MPEQGVAREFLEEAYSRLGYEIEFQILPRERSLYEANAGIFDGECTRIEGIEKEYSNLIRVPFLFGVVYVHAYILDSSSINSIFLDDLSEFKFGIVRGTKISEFAASYGSPVIVTNPRQLVLMLRSGKLDLICLEGFVYDKLKKDMPSVSSLVRINHPIVTKKIYHYIHKKHRNLIPGLLRVFQEMVKDGTYEEILRKHNLSSTTFTPIK